MFLNHNVGLPLVVGCSIGHKVTAAVGKHISIPCKVVIFLI